MRPKELLRVLEMHEVFNHRFHDCDQYNTCLTVAAKDDWRSFSCKGCSKFPESPKIILSEMNGGQDAA